MSDQSERLARAGEYVLGLLDDAARAEVEEQMRVDPAFRRAVDAFAARMGALDLTAEPAAPGDAMWTRIAEQIRDVPQEGKGAQVRTIPAKPATRLRWTRLQGLALAASLVAAVGLGYVAGRMTTSTPAPVVFVVLDTPDNRPGAVFEAYADNSVRIVPLEDFVVPEGKIMQVWTLYDKAVGPVSLGTMRKPEIAVLGGHPFPAPKNEQLYEITLEDAPESPSGKPTGPILVKGFAKRSPI